jgi:hypothetical protein
VDADRLPTITFKKGDDGGIDVVIEYLLHDANALLVRDAQAVDESSFEPGSRIF